MLNWLFGNKNVINKKTPVEDNEIKFNLIFHFHCIEHEKICYAISKIKEHIEIFNGYKIFTLSSPDNKFDNNKIFNLIIKTFESHGVQFIPVINNVDSRETLHFFDKASPLLFQLLQANNIKSSYTFYGHSKGCTHSEKDYAITAWVNTLYKYNLDLFFNNIKPIILTHKYKFIGCLKTIYGNMFGVKFHYAGTFFWFNSELLSPETKYNRGVDHALGLEMWPNTVATDEECYSVFDAMTDNPYKYDFWYNLVYNRVIDKPSTISCPKLGLK